MILNRHNIYEQKLKALDKQDAFIKRYGWRAWFDRVGLSDSPFRNRHPKIQHEQEANTKL